MKHFLGFPYVALTLFLSVRFLMASQDTLSNDLFWPDLNTTHGAAYVAKVFNMLLPGRGQQRVDLTSPAFAMVEFEPMPRTSFSAAYARTILLHRINTPTHVIPSLRRNQSMSNLWFQPTQFCWVDFHREFSLAHTAIRAERCLANETTNGAVYLESYLRNVDSKGFLAGWSSAFANGIVKPLQESTNGNAFLNTIGGIWNGSIHFTVDQEVAYWRSNGIAHFTMQWDNRFLPGLTEQITFISALGRHVSFTIKKQAASDGPRTSQKMNWLPGSDLRAVDDNTTRISGMSLIRGTSNFYESSGISMEQVMIENGTIHWPLTPKDQLVRQALGPFGSVDMKQLWPVDSLTDFILNTSRLINEKLLKDLDAQHAYATIPAHQQFRICPRAWRDPSWSFLGGNPLCSDGTAVDYLQTMVDFADTCTISFQEYVTLDRFTLLLSLLAVGNPSADRYQSICESEVDPVACVEMLNTTGQFINGSSSITAQDQAIIQSLAAKARQELLQVNPYLIQFVVNNSNASHYELLRQPVMEADPEDPWNVIGWWYAIGWAMGWREVIRFEGDHGELVLVSTELHTRDLDFRGVEIPTSMALTFLRIVQYTTLVSIVCAVLAISYALTNRGYVAGSHLLIFNRVVGAVWIGRPLLIARGVVAVCMISTSLVHLNVHGLMTTFDETQKTWLNVIIAAGESCWFSYMTTDVLVTFTQGYTSRYAMVAAILAQLVSAAVQLIEPFHHSAELNLQCEMPVFYEDVVCHGGTVQIGSLSRFITISTIAVAITVWTFALMRCLLSRAPTNPGGSMLLAGIAKEVYKCAGWMHEGRWYLDKSSAVLSGLVTLPFRGCTRVLDVKTWTLLYLQNGRLYDEKPQPETWITAVGGSRVDVPGRLQYAMALTLGFGQEVESRTNGQDVPAHKGTKNPDKQLDYRYAWSGVFPCGISSKSAKVASSPPANENEHLVVASSSLARNARMSELLRRCVGLLYVVWTLLLSIRFLSLSRSTLTTDLFWDDFNRSRTGQMIANTFNSMLLNGQQGQLTLSSPAFALFGTLPTNPQIEFSSTYVRTLLIHRLNTPQHAIASLRIRASTTYCLFQQTQFCWVDFNRTFSLAHTAKRAERCLANETTNGAVYFESFLRNFNATIFLNDFQPWFNTGIAKPLNESVAGRAFMESMDGIWRNGNPLTVDQEVQYWQSNGITHFTMQWGNFLASGVTEHVTLVNALGVSQNLTIKQVAASHKGQQTTLKFFWTPINDLWAVGDATTAISGMSLIRETAQFYENFNLSMEQIAIDDGEVPWPMTPNDQLLRQVLGPFASIDMKQLACPDSLFHLVMNATRIVNQRLLSNANAQEMYSNISEVLQLSVSPLAWRPVREDSNELVWTYLGGSPLCSFGDGVSYVQQFFEFSQDCMGTSEEEVHVTRVILVASLLAVNSPPPSAFQTICHSGTTMIDNCVEFLESASQFIRLYLVEDDHRVIQSLASRARDDLLQGNFELIQFTVNNSNSSHFELLRHPVMVSDPKDPWNVFGWWYAMGWAVGHREVVRFDGDDGALTLMSTQVPRVTLSLETPEISSSMSSTLFGVVQYTTLVAVCCGLTALLYAAASQGQVASVNLLQFNRVTGAVWIGRPLLFARGIVAVILVSSSHVVLTDYGLMTKFDEVPRPWHDVMIAAGETVWLSYVTTDLLVIVAKGYSYPCAVVGALLAQWIVALVEFALPFRPKTDIDLKCDITQFNLNVVCHSGTVEVGNLTRLLVITAVPIGITLLMTVVMRLVVTPTSSVPGASILLSGMAHEMYSSDGWMFHGRWHLDRASALLTGLVTIPSGGGGGGCVLDVKTWTLLYLNRSILDDKEHCTSPISAGATSVVPNGPRSGDLPPIQRHAMALTLQFHADKTTTTCIPSQT